MMSKENLALHEAMRCSPVFGGTDYPEWRKDMEDRYATLIVPPQVTRETVSAGGVDAEWFRAGGNPDQAILYVHGGGFALGSTRTHGAFIGELAVACGVDALGLNFRNPPEHPFPAALDDSVAAYQWLVSQGISPSGIAVIGDSAGGGLVGSFLLELREQGLPRPACAVLISAWADLTNSGESVVQNAQLDPINKLEVCEELAAVYADGHPLNDPRLSPVFGEWHDLCPLLLMVGDSEILFDDTMRIAEKARAAGTLVELIIGEDCVHVWPQYAQLHPEGVHGRQQIADFVGRHLG